MIHILHLKIVHYFLHVRQINDTFIDEASHNYISYVEAYVQFD